MRSTLTFVLTTWVVAGCGERSAAVPPGPSEAAAPDRDPNVEARYDGFEEPTLVEAGANVTIVHATLGALATAEEWGVTGCTSDTCDGLTVFATQVVGDTRFSVVGTTLTETCTWRVAIKTPRGWLGAITLGDSARGCMRPYDENAASGGWTLWFPIALDADARGARVEGQGGLMPEVIGDPDLQSTRSIGRVVLLCRSSRGVVACSERVEADQAKHPSFATVVASKPIASRPAFAPLSEAAGAGREWPAQWRFVPGADDALAHAIGTSTCRVVEHTLSTGQRVIVSAAESDRGMWIFHARGGVLHLVATLYADYENERVVLEGVHVDGDAVRVAVARVNEGRATITWRWQDIVTPTWHARLATGVAIGTGDDGEVPVAKWTRGLALTPTGLALSEGDGALAWFRGTGRFTWEGLGDEVARWRKQLARALATEGRHIRARNEDELGKQVVATLALVPGYAEPVDRTVVDLVRRHGL